LNKKTLDCLFDKGKVPAFGFKDLTFLGSYSTVESRLNTVVHFSLNEQTSGALPIINANMSNIAGLGLIKTLLDKKCFACSSRFHWNDPDYIEGISNLLHHPELFLSIGTNKEELETVISISKNYLMLDPTGLVKDSSRKINLLVDVAHANSVVITKFLSEIPKEFFNIYIGNYFGHEYAAFDQLVKQGVKGIRVGIGQGGSCLTTNGTTYGLPTLTSVYLADRWRRESGNKDFIIIADGGIKNPGDIIKCLHFGANIVCLGSYFSNCEEALGEIKREPYPPFRRYREFFGMSSHKSIKERVGLIRKGISSEGLVKKVYVNAFTSQKIDDFESFLRSAISYSGCSHIKDLSSKSEFMFVSPTVSEYNSSKDSYLGKSI